MAAKTYAAEARPVGLKGDDAKRIFVPIPETFVAVDRDAVRKPSSFTLYRYRSTVIRVYLTVAVHGQESAVEASVPVSRYPPVSDSP